jgi:uncharacterized protein (DUF1330 family)
MTAYMITLLSNRNNDWFEDYLVNVPPLIRKCGCDYVAFFHYGEEARGCYPGAAPAGDIHLSQPRGDRRFDVLR